MPVRLVRSIAIISFYTKGYNKYFRSFYETCQRHFFPDAQKKYFIFTDNPYISGDDIINIPIQSDFCCGMRYGYILELANMLTKFTNVVMFNGNTVILQPIGEKDDDQVFLQPLFGSTSGLAIQAYHALQSDSSKCAFVDIDREDISTYWRGGLWGGHPDNLLRMCSVIAEWVRKDRAQSDEVYVNRYFLDQPKPIPTLDARYIWTGSWGYNPYFDIRVVMADKQGGYDKLRGSQIEDRLMKAYATVCNADGSLWLGPGRWPQIEAVDFGSRTPSAMRSDIASASTSLSAFRVGSVIAHSVLPPILTRMIQITRRKIKIAVHSKRI